MTGYCKECGKECGIYGEDDSFDHEFGTEHGAHVASDCCDAEVYHDEDLIHEVTVQDLIDEHADMMLP